MLLKKTGNGGGMNNAAVRSIIARRRWFGCRALKFPTRGCSHGRCQAQAESWNPVVLRRPISVLCTEHYIMWRFDRYKITFGFAMRAAIASRQRNRIASVRDLGPRPLGVLDVTTGCLGIPVQASADVAGLVERAELSLNYLAVDVLSAERDGIRAVHLKHDSVDTHSPLRLARSNRPGTAAILLAR